MLSKRLLVFTILVINAANLWSADNGGAAGGDATIDLSDVPSSTEIERSCRAMGPACSRRCSVFQNIVHNCFQKCMRKESIRAQAWQVRRYVASCRSDKLDEPLNFEPLTPEQEFAEIVETMVADSRCDDPVIKRCARAKMQEHHRRAIVLLESAEAAATAEAPVSAAIASL